MDSMYGRFGRTGDKQRIAEEFGVRSDFSTLAMPPSHYNIAPSTFQPVIRESREDGSRETVLMRWGLIPFFTKAPASIKGISTINPRAETVQTAPTWREPFKKRRCIVPVSHFYEWKKLDAKTKQPFAFRVSGNSMFAFAEWLIKPRSDQASRLPLDCARERDEHSVQSSKWFYGRQAPAQSSNLLRPSLTD